MKIREHLFGLLLREAVDDAALAAEAASDETLDLTETVVRVRGLWSHLQNVRLRDDFPTRSCSVKMGI